MRQSLMVVGVLLEMAAAKNIHSSAGKDTDGQVATYVAKALALSEAGFNEPLSDGQQKETARLGHVLGNHLPLWHGMKLATKIEGAVSPGIQQTFNKRLQSLEKSIKDAESNVRNADKYQPRRALQMYDQLKAL